MKDYVTFEQAQRLKELGFDWECYYHYETNRLLVPNVRTFYYSMDIDSDDLCINVNGHNIGDISAPTLAQAQKWLREVKDIIIGVDFDNYDNKFTCHCYKKLRTIYGSHLVLKDGNDFDNYEEALSAGIDKALELLK